MYLACTIVLTHRKIMAFKHLGSIWGLISWGWKSNIQPKENSFGLDFSPHDNSPLHLLRFLSRGSILNSQRNENHLTLD